MILKKIKELQGTVNARANSLDRAEEKVKELTFKLKQCNEIIIHQEKEIKDLKTELKSKQFYVNEYLKKRVSQ